MKYAFTKICINAPFATTQFGHIQQTFLVSEYKDNLYARIYSFINDNLWIIHACCDSIGLNESIRNEMQSKLRKFYDNENIHFILSATHSHYCNNPNDQKYRKFFIDTVLNGVYKMKYKDINNISVSYRKHHTKPCGKSRISNYETNLELLSCISFFNEDSNFLNIIIHNCHPTTLSATTNYFSAEYPGVLLAKLESTYDNVDFVFMQGAAGDISSRFTRSGQNYEDMLKNANNIYNETVMLLNTTDVRKPFKLKFYEEYLNIKHDLKPIDLSNIRKDLSNRELQVIEYGKKIREAIISQSNFVKNTNVCCIDFGLIKLVTSSNELFSAYMKDMNLDERILICYTNGDSAYVLPKDFNLVTYEMFYDTWSLESKEKLIFLLENLGN